MVGGLRQVRQRRRWRAIEFVHFGRGGLMHATAVYFLHGSGTKCVLVGAKETKLGEFSAGCMTRRKALAGWELEQKFSAEVS